MFFINLILIIMFTLCKKLLTLFAVLSFSFTVFAQNVGGDTVVYRRPSSASRVKPIQNAAAQTSVETPQNGAGEKQNGNPRFLTTYGIYYKATSFSDFKESGGYGLNVGGRWRCGGEQSRFYLGFTFQIFQFNFGLVPSDFTSDQSAFGLSPLVYFNKSCNISFPITVNCNYGFSKEIKALMGKSTVWSLEFIPQVHFTLIDVGLVLSTSLENISQFTLGMYLGLSID